MLACTLSRSTAAIALALWSVGAPPSAVRAESTAPAAVLRVPVGDAEIDIEDAEVDQKMGSAFVLGMRSGATNCLIASLWKDPHVQGAITFVARPPAGDGRYLVTLQSADTIGSELEACVRGLFDGFYHYAGKPAFDRLQGTLRFTPRFVDGPAPPGDAALRAILDRRYARAGVVRVVEARQTDLAHDADGSTGIFRRYGFEVELEFTTDGYETTCRHYGPYKIFGTRPYTSPGAGHTCSSVQRRRGERARDTAEIDYRLELYPAVGKTWELRSGDH